MCRFLVYKGKEPIQLSHLVTRPRHSIINQAFESKLRMPSSRPLNADGFGIGWYDAGPHTPAPQPGVIATPGGVVETATIPLPGCGCQAAPLTADAVHEVENEKTEKPDQAPANDQQKQVDLLNNKRGLERELEAERPCVFKSLSPAWSSANLTRLAEKIRSPLVFAHVRASTVPGAPSEDNCHPWVFNRLMWMHNGEISSFPKIKRKMQESLSDELYLYPSGYTDSEWTFMVFLSNLRDPHARSFTHVELRDAMQATIAFINKLSKEAGITSPHLLNYVVSDGESVVATRYISSRTSEASSLFFSSGTSFNETQDGGLYRMTKADKRENVIMIASEPLTFERADWMEVKTNTMLVITPKMNLLQIPIIDEYWVLPQDPASQHRSKDAAISMGFGHGFAAEEVAAA